MSIVEPDTGELTFDPTPFMVEDAQPGHHTYRIRSWTGLLIYVGCTNDIDRRLREHRSRSPWFPLAKSVEVESHWSSPSAQLAEREAIRTEYPLFNRERYEDPTSYEADFLAGGGTLEDASAELFGTVFGGMFG